MAVENHSGPVIISEPPARPWRSQDAARTLAADQLAAFGALPTADQFSGHSFAGFDQVTPNVSAQVRVLREVLRVPANTVLVRDRQATGLYPSDTDIVTLSSYGQVLSPDIPVFLDSGGNRTTLRP